MHNIYNIMYLYFTIIYYSYNNPIYYFIYALITTKNIIALYINLVDTKNDFKQQLIIDLECHNMKTNVVTIIFIS